MNSCVWKNESILAKRSSGLWTRSPYCTFGVCVIWRAIWRQRAGLTAPPPQLPKCTKYSAPTPPPEQKIIPIRTTIVQDKKRCIKYCWRFFDVREKGTFVEQKKTETHFHKKSTTNFINREWMFYFLIQISTARSAGCAKPIACWAAGDVAFKPSTK